MLTACTRCGGLYSAASEEQACEPDRLCRACTGGEVECPTCEGTGTVRRWAMTDIGYHPSVVRCPQHLCEGGRVPALTYPSVVAA
jgi:hypothetical protein